MTLQELKYLVAIADHLHFGRAAEACHVTQPTLSAGLRNLERKLGRVLCERSAHGVLLTRAGEPLVAQARRVLAEVRQLEQMAQTGTTPLTGLFRLGAIPTIAPYLFPHIIGGLRRQWPGLQLNLVEGKTADLLRDLRQGGLDAALLSPPIDDTGLACARLYREDFVLALPSGHPLQDKRTLRVDDLADEPLLLLDEGHCLRDQVVEFCRIGDAAARERLRSSSLETLRNMVAAGAGCTLLPALAIPATAEGRAALNLRSLARPAPGRDVNLYWRVHYAGAASAEMLAGSIRELVPTAVRTLA